MTAHNLLAPRDEDLHLTHHDLVRPDLPSGTVTFLFTDVEGSTRLLHELGADAYAAALAEHRRILRTAFAAYGGVEVDTQGDAFFVAFAKASDALAAAADGLASLVDGPIKVRMGLHTAEPHLAASEFATGPACMPTPGPATRCSGPPQSGCSAHPSPYIY